MLKNRRASYFFLIDAIIAAFIFFIAVSLITVSMSSNNNIETPKFYAENIMNYYIDTDVRDINDDFIEDLIRNKVISQPDLSIMEQILIFNKYSSPDLEGFIVNVTSSKLPDIYGLKISLINNTDESVIYTRNPIVDGLNTYITVRRIAITKLPDNTIYGPLIFTVSVWS